MRIIARKTLANCWVRHPEVEAPLKEWYNKVVKVNWENPGDVTNSFSNARYIQEGRFIFNIKNNDFRLVVKVNFVTRIVYIRFVGTHAEYDKIDPKNV